MGFFPARSTLLASDWTSATLMTEHDAISWSVAFGFFPLNIESAFSAAFSAHLRMMQSIQHANEADLYVAVPFFKRDFIAP